jgi:hypothetical protein
MFYLTLKQSFLPVRTVFGPPSTTRRTTGTGSIHRNKFIMRRNVEFHIKPEGSGRKDEVAVKLEY